MTSNIKSIELWEDNPGRTNDVDLVKIKFKFPCTWTALNLEDLLKILKLWIEGEEKAYPPSKGFSGRWLLFNEIMKVFAEKLDKK